MGTLCGPPGAVAFVAPAGSGKTYTLAAAVTGVCFAAAAATATATATATAELTAAAGIRADTLTAVTTRPFLLPPGGIVVVDETGMIGTCALDPLVEHATRCGAKLVLVGDHRQLPEIGAGGVLGTLLERIPTATLTSNRCQHHPWEQAALTHLRHGRTDQALDLYRQHGRIHRYTSTPATSPTATP